MWVVYGWESMADVATISNLSGLISIAGLSVFGVGVLASRKIRLATGDYRWMSALNKYQNLPGVARWPLYCVYICLPLGKLIAFGSVFVS